MARLGHLLIYLFICLTALALSIFFFTLCLYMAVLGLRCCASFSLVSKSGGYSSLRCRGFSCCRAPALGHTGPVIAVLELWNTGPVVAAHGLSCSEACGIKPVSPALAGRFLTTEPPGKPLQQVFAVSHEIFLVWHWGSLVEACGIWFPEQGSNLGPLHWEQS